MSKLIPVLIAGLFCAIMSENFSFRREDEYGVYYVYKNRNIVILLIMIMAVFAGLRTSYNDTITYKSVYEQLVIGKNVFEGINWLKIGDNPGFNFVNQILKNNGVSTQSFFMLYALITIGIYIWFIRKYSNHFALSVYLFITMGCFVFAMAAIKQCVAVAFCLVATDRAINKKYIRFVLWVILASTFHAYSFMYLLLPLLAFKPWSKRSYILLAMAGAAGVSLQALMGSLIDITTMLGEEYDMTSFSGDGVNIFRVAVVWAPVVLSFLTRRFLQKKNDRAVNIIVNLTMLNAMLMFIGLFGTANYFARLANYFLIFQTIALPFMIDAFTRESRRTLTTIIVICYWAYFYYATAIMYGGFDAGFTRIGLGQYLNQLF